MEQLTVSREIVKQKYLTGNKDERKLLKELFFSDEYQITDIVTTLEDAYKETGRVQPEFSDVPKDLKPFFKALFDVIVFTEALNEKQKFNYRKLEQKKYFPQLEVTINPEMRFNDVLFSTKTPLVGEISRICLKNKKLAEHAGKTFTEQYQKLLTL